MDLASMNKLLNNIDLLEGDVLTIQSSALDCQMKTREVKQFLKGINISACTSNRASSSESTSESEVNDKINDGHQQPSIKIINELKNFTEAFRIKVQEEILKISEAANSKLDELNRYISQLEKSQEKQVDVGCQTNGIHAENLPNDDFGKEEGREEREEILSPATIPSNLVIDKCSQETIYNNADNFRQDFENENSKWLLQVKPQKISYYPQIKDQLVYLRQAHFIYLETTEKYQIYAVSELEKSLVQINNWSPIFVEVEEITFEKLPNLACITLAILDNKGQETGQQFKVKYLTLPDVADFLVLKQVYDRSLKKTWKVGDKINYQAATIRSIEPFDNRFPASLFKRYCVEYNDVRERFSPWEMEPATSRLSIKTGEKNLEYEPEPKEWLNKSRHEVSGEIFKDLDELIELPGVNVFANMHSDDCYTTNVEYPIYLTIIKYRLRNNFYRRISSMKFDVEYYLKNIENIKRNNIRFANMSNSLNNDMLSTAKAVTLTLAKVMEYPNQYDVQSLMNEYEMEESQTQTEESSSTYNPSTQADSERQETMSQLVRNWSDWEHACFRVLEALRSSEFAEHFKYPIDHHKHPEYLRIVPREVCLQSISEQLDGGNFKSPNEFCEDIELMFSNCKIYTTDEKTQVRRHCAKLEEIFDLEKTKFLLNYVSPSKRKSQTIQSPKAGPSRRDNEDVFNESPSKRRKILTDTDSNHLNNSLNQSPNRNARINDRNVNFETNRNRTSDTSNAQIVKQEQSSQACVGMQQEQMNEQRPNIQELSENNDLNVELEQESSDEEPAQNKEPQKKEGNVIVLKKIKKQGEKRLDDDEVTTEKGAYTSSAVLRNLQSSDFISQITARVDEVFYNEFQKLDGLKKLVSFTITNDDNCTIYCKAWQEQAEKYRKKIKRNRMIRLVNPKLMAASPYNERKGYLKNFEIIIDKYNTTSIYQSPRKVN